MVNRVGLIAPRAVLDKGLVVCDDVLGSDRTIIDAARFCYQSEGTPDTDRKLLQRLVVSRPAHNTVFEHVVFRFRVKCPIFVARQWMRHRIGTFNEKSLRYCTASPEYYVPSDLSEQNRAWYIRHCSNSFDLYTALVESGMKKEQARGVLPMAMYTEFLWTVNAWSLMNWFEKRLDPAAQWEHRQYARAIMGIFRMALPITGKAFSELIEKDTHNNHDKSNC